MLVHSSIVILVHLNLKFKFRFFIQILFKFCIVFTEKYKLPTVKPTVIN